MLYNRDWDYYEEPQEDYVKVDINKYYQYEEREEIYKQTFENIKEELDSYLKKESTADEFAKWVKRYLEELEEEI